MFFQCDEISAAITFCSTVCLTVCCVYQIIASGSHKAQCNLITLPTAITICIFYVKLYANVLLCSYDNEHKYDLNSLALVIHKYTFNTINVSTLIKQLNNFEMT